MCDALTLFLPVKNAVAPTAIRDLVLSTDGDLNRGLRLRFGEKGTYLGASTNAPCLCGFDRWSDFFAMVREALAKNKLEWAAAIYAHPREKEIEGERELDPLDPKVLKDMSDHQLVIFRPVLKKRK